VHLVGFIIRIYHDARSPERRNVYFTGTTKKKTIIYILHTDYTHTHIYIYIHIYSVPLATEPGSDNERTGKDFPKYGAPGSILSGRKWWPLLAHVMMSHFLYNDVSPLQISLQYSH